MLNDEDWKLNDKDWDLLLARINDKECTPFLGAGACHPILPLGSDIAKEWSKKYGYPLRDSWDLVRVAQFLAVDKDDMFPKSEIIKMLKKNKKLPDFKASDEIHGVLADLELPVYITTNYDDFMMQALINRGKDVKREFCRWNQAIKNRPKPSIFESGGFTPTLASPVVFHLHGNSEKSESIVITRDDYLDFLVNINKDTTNTMIPPRIQDAFTSTSLLFLGYSLDDWSFQVIFRHIINNLQISFSRVHVSVQLAPGERYLFTWDEIPGNDDIKLIEFLKENFSIDCLEAPKIEKTDDDMTIKVSTEKKSFSLKLNDEKTKVNLETKDGADEFITKIESKKINVYKLDYEQKARSIKYLNKYFGDRKIRVYWGTCCEFAAELKRRMGGI